VVGESFPVGMPSHAVLWMVRPEDQIQAILEEITGLIEDGVLNGGQGNALIVKLENILKQLDNSKPQVACNLLEAFTSQVQSFIDEGVLPLEVGQLLLAKANTVQSQICQ
jgi:predicted Mrr-cat superfamily restriction endonuclease